MRYLEPYQYNAIKEKLSRVGIDELYIKLKTKMWTSKETLEAIHASESYEDFLNIYNNSETHRKERFKAETCEAQSGYVWVKPKTITDIYQQLDEIKKLIMTVGR